MSEERVNIRLTSSGGPQVAAAFGAVRTAATGLGAAIRNMAAPLGLAFSGASVVHGIREAINSADEFAKVAQRVGQTTESLSALAYAGDLSGVSMEELTVGLQKFNQWLSQTGQGARDNMQAFEEQADIFARMPDGPNKTALAMELFGKAGAKMIPLLNGGRDGIREMAEEAERFGLVIGGATAKEAEEFNDNLTRLQKNATGLANTLAKTLLPSLNDITKTLLASRAAVGTDQSGLGGMFQAVGNFLTGQFTRQAREVTSVGQGIYGFASGILSGKGFQAATAQGVAQFAESLNSFNNALAKMNKEAGDGTKDQEGFAAALDDVRRRLELDFDSNRTSLSSIAGDPTLSRIEKRSESLKILQEQLRITKQLQADLEASMPADAVTFTDDNGEVRVTEEWLKRRREALDLNRQQVDVMNQMDALGPDPASFSGQFAIALGDIQDAWGTWAEQAAQSFQSVFGTVVGSLTDGITALITRTQTWGEALRNIGTSILSGVVRAIVGVGVQWIATQIVMAAAGKAIQAGAVATAAPIAAASSAIWAAPATLATIATYGAAAASAPGFITAASGITTATSVGQALAGFARGGYTGDGPRDQVAGVVHRGEYVVPAPQVARIGVPILEAMVGGDGAGVAGSGGGDGRPITLNFWDGRLSAETYARTQDFENRVLEVVNRNGHRVRV